MADAPSRHDSDPDRPGPMPVRPPLPAREPEAPSPARGEAAASDPRRPTPVRQGMETDRDDAVEASAAQATFSRGAESWIARVEGRGGSGGARDSGTPLLFLSFSPAEDPGSPRFEALCVARRLADLTEAHLLDALRGAVPYQSDWQRKGLFSETHRGGSRK